MEDVIKWYVDVGRNFVIFVGLKKERIMWLIKIIVLIINSSCRNLSIGIKLKRKMVGKLKYVLKFKIKDNNLNQFRICLIE